MQGKSKARNLARRGRARLGIARRVGARHGIWMGKARQGSARQEQGMEYGKAGVGTAGLGTSEAWLGIWPGEAGLGGAGQGMAWNLAGAGGAWHGKEHWRAHPQEQQTNTTTWTANHYTQTH